MTGPDSTTGLAAAALDVGARAGKPVRLPVETHDLGPGPVARKQTFHGSTREALAQALAAVDAVERSQTAYRGDGGARRRGMDGPQGTLSLR